MLVIRLKAQKFSFGWMHEITTTCKIVQGKMSSDHVHFDLISDYTVRDGTMKRDLL